MDARVTSFSTFRPPRVNESRQAFSALPALGIDLFRILLGRTRPPSPTFSVTNGPNLIRFSLGFTES